MFSAPAAGLTDLPATLPDSDRYTSIHIYIYIYEGNSQVPDHPLISPALVTAGYDRRTRRPPRAPMPGRAGTGAGAGSSRVLIASAFGSGERLGTS